FLIESSRKRSGEASDCDLGTMTKKVVLEDADVRLLHSPSERLLACGVPTSQELISIIIFHRPASALLFSRRPLKMKKKTKNRWSKKVPNVLFRLDIHHLKSVNKKLYEISADRSLEHIKWIGGRVYISKTQNGYGFELQLLSEDYPWKREVEDYKRMDWNYDPEVRYSYAYEVVRTGNGRFEETRQTNRVLPSSHTLIPHSWPIPDKFYTALHELTRLHELKSLSLMMPFSSINFAKLDAPPNILSVRSFFYSDTSDEPIRDDTRRSFAHFAKHLQCVNLRPFEVLTSILNEEFIQIVAQSTRFKHFLCTTSDDQAHRFHPDESILTSLLGFKTLEAATMVLNVNWIAKLCMMFMDKIAHPSWCDGSWRIGVDHPLTSESIRRHLREFEFEYFARKDNHYIVRRRDGFTAKLCPHEWYGGEMLVIEMVFYGSREIRGLLHIQEGGRCSPDPKSHGIRPSMAEMMSDEDDIVLDDEMDEETDDEL
ncbi:hypothetical protein PRIPAC_75746, partial [Pristionchus pacificus]|uniref:Uncharacterized protein n=1 Tax=Pristionchus pacificus TaxID=54126 RepID=A0A2A6BRI3_PRIPA